MAVIGEYIWLDGSTPTRKLRSKTKIIPELSAEADISVSDFPNWQFDGSSTGQAEGDSSDCLLEPVTIIPDPIRGLGSYLVMCEVLNPDGTPQINTRAQLRPFWIRALATPMPGLDSNKNTPYTMDLAHLAFPQATIPAARSLLLRRRC